MPVECENLEMLKYYSLRKSKFGFLRMWTFRVGCCRVRMIT